MQKNVYAIKNFTSYFDRRVRRLGSFSEYLEGRIYWQMLNTNFAINDGVTTSVVFNLTSPQQEETTYDSGVPNYVIVCDLNENNILSRWYVTECKYIRENQ